MTQAGAGPPKNPHRKQIGVGGLTISERAKALVMEVLDSGRLSAGPMMARFESEIASIHGCRHGLMCNSGTSALQIALGALKERYGWQDGDEVLVPALTFVATANIVLYNSLTPVFVDVEREFFDIDPRKIEERITPRTRAIIPVHIAGLPCDMTPILEIARRYNLRTVEDSCEAMFVNYKGQPVGSFGDIACFSTYIAHIITTGVGGLCTTNDLDLLVSMKSLMNHGRDSIYIRCDDDQDVKGSDLFQIANSRFSFIRFGHSFRCTEMEAALGLAQIEDRRVRMARREEIASRLTQGLRPFGNYLQLPRAREGADHGFMFYPLAIIDPAVHRDDLILFLEERGIETRYLLPLIDQPIYRKVFGNLDAQYPVAAQLNQNAFYIGCHPEMTDDDIEYMIEQFRQYFGERT